MADNAERGARGITETTKPAQRYIASFEALALPQCTHVIAGKHPSPRTLPQRQRSMNSSFGCQLGTRPCSLHTFQARRTVGQTASSRRSVASKAPQRIKIGRSLAPGTTASHTEAGVPVAALHFWDALNAKVGVESVRAGWKTFYLPAFRSVLESITRK